MHAGARGEVRPDLPYRAVKGWSGDLRGTIVRLDVVSLLMPANQVEQARVLDRHPLRTAGRARGVNHIGKLLRRHGAALEAAPGASFDAPLRRVHVQNRRIQGRQGAGKMLPGQCHDRLRILQHEADAFGGILRIDGHISRACFPHAQNGDEHLDRALEQDADQGTRMHTQHAQLLGQCFRALVELPVGHPSPAAFRRERLRANASLFLDQFVHAPRRGISHRGLIPDLDQSMALRFGQKWQVLQPGLRTSGHRLEQRAQMAEHARGDVVGEALPRVFELQQKVVVAIGDERQWIVGMAETSKAALAPGPAQSAQLRIERMAIEHQDALEQRHASGQLAPALDADQRGVLVVAQRHLLSAQLPQPAHEVRFRINAHAYRQRIDEQADHVPGTAKRRPATGGVTPKTMSDSPQ